MMIKLAERNTCTGCHACMNVCPKNAITMVEDSEGFLQPNINTDKCVGCKLCQKTCPVLNPLPIENATPKVYAFINYPDRKISSSGGAFSFFARKILAEGGVVFGATIDKNLKVYHISIEKTDELYKLRESKYVQSKIGTSYKEAKKYLTAGRKVLFTGTPCQIAGLYKYLGKRWAGLLVTLDLVCHGVPSQKVFDTYLGKLAKLKKFLPTVAGEIVGFRFRNVDSWSIVPAVKVTNYKNWCILNQESNTYMTAFFKGLIFRECCYNCKYANTKRIGTFTIADYWGVGTKGTKFQKNISAGVSMIIDNNELIDKFIKPTDNIYIEERTLEEATLKNENLNHPFVRPKGRDAAIMDLLSPKNSLKDYAQKYDMLDPFFKNLVKILFKRMVYGVGLYNVYKTISYKIGRTS